METSIQQLLPANVYQAAVNANAPSLANPFATMADVGGSDEWSEVLGNGNNTGGNDTVWSSGDVLRSEGISNLLATVVGPIGAGPAEDQTTLTGITYSVHGDRLATIKLGATITITGTANNDGVHVITAAETVGTGPYKTFFQFAGIAADVAGGTVQTDNGALIIDFNNPDFYAPNEALDGYMLETNDGVGGAAKAWREFHPRYHQLGYGQAYHYMSDGGTNNSSFTIYGTNFDFTRPYVSYNIIGENIYQVNLGNTLFTKNAVIQIQENDTTSWSYGNLATYPMNINSQNVTINQNVINAVAVAAKDAVVKTDNSTYVNAVAFNEGAAGEMRLVHTANAADFTATLQAKTGTIAYLSDITAAVGDYVPIAGNAGNPMTGNLVLDPSIGITSSSNSNYIRLNENTNQLSLYSEDDVLMTSGTLGVTGTTIFTQTNDAFGLFALSSDYLKTGSFQMFNNTIANRNFSSGAGASFPMFIASQFAQFSDDVTNVVIAGGKNVTGKTSDALYSNKFILSEMEPTNPYTAVADAGGGQLTISAINTLSNGEKVRLNSTNGTKYNGYYTVSNVTGTSFEITEVFNGDFPGVFGYAYETVLNAVTPTADRTATLQNASGTIAYLTDIPAGAGDNIYNSNGLFPALADRIATLNEGTLKFQQQGVGLGTQPIRDVLSLIATNANAPYVLTNTNYRADNGTSLVAATKWASLDKDGLYSEDNTVNNNGFVVGQDPSTGLGKLQSYATGFVNSTTVNFLNPTGVNTISIQDGSGTLAFLSDIPAGAGDNFATADLTLAANRVQDLATFNLEFDTGAGGKMRFSATPGGPPATKEMDIYVNSTAAYIHALGAATPGGTPLVIIGGEQPGVRGISLQTVSNIIEWNDTANTLIHDASAVTGSKTATWQDASGTVAYNTGQAWSVPTNVTTTRAIDANSTTLNEVADVLGTLIADLRTGNILS